MDELTQGFPTSRNASVATDPGDGSIVQPTIVIPTKMDSMEGCTFPVRVFVNTERTFADTPPQQVTSEVSYFEMDPPAEALNRECRAVFNVGRGPPSETCQIACHNGSVSRVHCVVEVAYKITEGQVVEVTKPKPKKGGKKAATKKNEPAQRSPSVLTIQSSAVMDRGSLNGTTLNGVRLYPNHAYFIKRWQLGSKNDATKTMSISIPTSEDTRVTVMIEFVSAVDVEGNNQPQEIAANNDLIVMPQLPLPETKPPGEAPKATGAAPTQDKKQQEPAVEPEEPKKKGSGKASAMSPRRVVSKIIKTRVKNAADQDEELRKEESASAKKASGGKSAGDKKATPTDITVVTTGLKISDALGKDCKKAGIRVNPDFKHFHKAKYLVAEPPLQRSVKLLCAWPHIDGVVTKAWLERVAREQSITEPTAAEQYHEVRTRNSIETTNQFSIVTTLRNFDVEQRRKLFGGKKFWVHHKAVPQDPPNNDLKSVIENCGGTVINDPACADVLVVPTTSNHPVMIQRTIMKYIDEENVKIISPNDLFMAVLGQSKLQTTVVPNAEGQSPKPTKKSSASGKTPASASKRKTEDPAAKEEEEAPKSKKKKK